MNSLSIESSDTEEAVALDVAMDRAWRGIRDREESLKALEQLTHESEEIRQRLGTLNIVVELVREARNP